MFGNSNRFSKILTKTKVCVPKSIRVIQINGLYHQFEIILKYLTMSRRPYNSFIKLAEMHQDSTSEQNMKIGRV